ncbi:hypothetical protein QN277_023523 [Acacia crassicarpa]|uniref:Uncharacterized protein n=1 Tax=Acacia crassicarpa TaxID=499986 RepID=A0AAE1JLH1_9FABA|nr:hypothetical protein QN277_023523 [Acacia crassicarpa]
MTEWKRKLAETGVPPESVGWAAFERTHSRQSEGSDEREWINSRAHTVAENYTKLSQERDSQRETDPSSSVCDNDSLFIQAAGGFDKKGRVFGYGAAASRLKPTKRSSSGIEDVSADEMKKMKALTAQMTQEQERMLEEQEKMRQMMIQEREMMEERMAKEREMMEERMRRMQEEMMRRMQEEMMRQMQIQLKSLMNKGSGSAPGDDDHAGDDDDDHNAPI